MLVLGLQAPRPRERIGAFLSPLFGKGPTRSSNGSESSGAWWFRSVAGGESSLRLLEER